MPADLRRPYSGQGALEKLSARPRSLLAAPALGLALVACLGAVPRGEAQAQTPPPITINLDAGSLAPGYIFIGPEPSVPTNLAGPEILDNQGRVVWFKAVPSGYVAADFRVQTYMGNPVLTWSQAAAYGTVNPTTTTDYILDNTYNVVATVTASPGRAADLMPRNGPQWRQGPPEPAALGCGAEGTWC